MRQVHSESAKIQYEKVLLNKLYRIEKPDMQ